MVKKINIKSLEVFLQTRVLHIYSKDEHVSIIEKAVSNVKEQTRYICHAVTYK